MHVDVQIDVLDAALRLPMLAAGVPRAVAQRHLLNPRQKEAAPLAAGRERRARLARKLKDQHLLLVARVSDDVRAQLAPMALTRT